MSKDQKIAKLEEMIAAQVAMIDKLLAEFTIQRAQKHSGISSMNPASDLKPNGKTNLREKSGKKQGRGNKGANLETCPK